MTGRNTARWLARKAPKAARQLVLYLSEEPHLSWERGDLPDDTDALAAEIHSIAEGVAEEHDTAIVVKLAWLGPQDRELTHHTYSVGVATGDARIDGTHSASAHNAQRHVEAMVRLLVQQTQTLARSWSELGNAQRERATDAEREARKLREELRAIRDQQDGREPDEPSAMDGVVERLLPSILAAAQDRMAGGSPRPPGAPEGQ